MNTTHSPSDMPCASTDGEWFKSSYSNGSGGECVEAAFLAGGAGVRDSKRPHGPRLTFADPAWAEFVGALRAGRM
ncbi:DUF397 domain-containing protein [Streptomyces sp. CBMA152]|uniref:DUF397 domain-containing protein n=1 Tax=Streptomyces sp. CBMA152 TaxID=1896312 RepID=UPI001CB73CE9|nr:DUF397 domain-containing protein [Streptomyces sp. CBMA152]MBD0747526.1 hypothetical protein [Streptomyces sp. CBMA152]